MASTTSTGVKSIHALQRGMEVLYAVERSSSVTLGELHLHTLIPKASLLRILKTLQAGGWIERNADDGRYARTPAAGDTGRAVQWRTQLTALAAQPRASLQRKMPWPTDLAVRDGRAMLVLDTHQPLVGLSVNYRVIGFRPHLLVSALGRCYLAFCPDAEREALLAVLARSPDGPDQVARQAAQVRRWLAGIRSAGYAVRDPRHAVADHRMAQRFGGLAVPVMVDGQVVACLGCAWLEGVTTEQEMVRAHLASMLDTAQAIAQQVRKSGWPQAPG